MTLKAGLYEGKKKIFPTKCNISISAIYRTSKNIFQGNVKHKRTMPKTRLNRETTIRTEITCKKSYGYMRDLACRWLIFEYAKIF